MWAAYKFLYTGLSPICYGKGNMKPTDIRFSVNRYDAMGDVIEVGIYLHFGETIIRVADNFNDFKTIVWQMEKIVKEYEENYGPKA